MIWLIEQWMKADLLISEILVDVSKWHISSEDAVDKIRAALIANKAADFPYSYKIDKLKTELDFFMRKISKKECWKRLGLK